ncbi:endonuclease [Oleiharenicola lentus]|uniref:Endonuclease n=1 Tax=Oleiharenicola lentus TaxID=2508720 RepID=A0A4Q1C813_9BACT|nr:endonuclease/exonuclease/phosphatase family protein [Oleiharenicola lentus]RXK55074.1 endonuclease [Oleiharenicola lentus]
MSGRFKVLQFNMQYGQPWDDTYPDTAPIRIRGTVDEIRAHNADIVMLQELEQTLSGGVQAQPPPHYTRLRKEFPAYDGYFSYPKPDERELPFGIGLAILSKTPLREHVCMNLPSPPVEFDFLGEKKTPTDRLLIGATTTIHGREVRLLNTHLLAFFMLKSSSELHLDQRKLVEDQLRRSTEVPTLLTGDFNVSKHQSLIEQFANAGYRTVQSTEPTWRRRPYVLDHIFYNRWLRPVSHTVKPTPASDHHTLSAEFEFVE